MLILVLLVNLAQTVLGICAILQFFWMLFTNERNPGIAWFGQGLARWLAITARFLTVANFHSGGDGEALMRGMRQHPCTEGL
ncbi:DUF4389 domain-containing protein [Ectothiorhodospira sp. BSL-9]|uniref:DUF4389 domain-containing protein n=1 Tax=Ectothiorhodospira sp. BSL-9 TaxID=1442136 RepID=UPI0007B45659|nr:DUF4389 domain-containing protein [Ectothiorhodospira sp. BSL-9]ANB01801.1 hypothetical protein ECTOBSL9_1007 [Ectothiorhodospira sp. BSL-9]